MTTMFGPDTSAASPGPASTRSGDLLHRTARRYPDKLAVVAGDLRVDLRRVRRRGQPGRAALADRGLAKGDRLALLSHNCWQFAVLAFATRELGVVLVPVNFMLGADEIAFILDHSRRQRVRRRGRAGRRRRSKALAAAGSTAGCAAWIRLAGAAPADGWEDVDDWLDHDGRRRTPTSPSTTTTRCG